MVKPQYKQEDTDTKHFIVTNILDEDITRKVKLPDGISKG